MEKNKVYHLLLWHSLVNQSIESLSIFSKTTWNHQKRLLKKIHTQHLYVANIKMLKSVWCLKVEKWRKVLAVHGKPPKKSRLLALKEMSLTQHQVSLSVLLTQWKRSKGKTSACHHREEISEYIKIYYKASKTIYLTVTPLEPDQLNYLIWTKERALCAYFPFPCFVAVSYNLLKRTICT